MAKLSRTERLTRTAAAGAALAASGFILDHVLTDSGSNKDLAPISVYFSGNSPNPTNEDGAKAILALEGQDPNNYYGNDNNINQLEDELVQAEDNRGINPGQTVFLEIPQASIQRAAATYREATASYVPPKTSPSLLPGEPSTTVPAPSGPPTPYSEPTTSINRP